MTENVGMEASRDIEEVRRATREQELLVGALISVPGQTDSHHTDYASGVDETWFDQHKLRLVFRAIEALNEDGQDPTLLAINAWLTDNGLAQECEPEYVRGLVRAHQYPVANLVDRIRKVRGRRVLRELLTEHRQMLDESAAKPDEIFESFVEAYEAAVVTSAQQTGGLKVIEDVMTQMFADLMDESVQKRSAASELDTTYHDWSMMAPLAKGAMTVIAARPGGCKTTLCMNVAARTMQKGSKVAFFSIETKEDDIQRAVMASLSGVPTARIKRNEIDADDYDDMKRAHETCRERDGHISVYHMNPLTVGALSTLARKHKRRFGLDLLVVDYLQLLTSGQRVRLESRQLEVSMISASLKALAHQLDVPLVVAAQLNRAIEGTDRPPRMSDLRESGAIEQDCDVCLMLRNEPPKTEKGRPCIRVYVVKNRGGRLGEFSLEHDGARAQLLPVVSKTEPMFADPDKD